MIKIQLILMMLLLTLTAAQCGAAPTAPAENQGAASGSAQISITEASARASIPNGSVYFNLTNQGNQDDRLVGVETDAAERAELHETQIDANDVMRMKPVESIDIPAGGSTRLEPGGKHIMLINLKQSLAVGDKISLTLNFEYTGRQTIEVEVTESLATEHQGEHK